MNVKNYNLEELLLTAMRSEIDSKNFYSKLSERVENFLLQERLKFLSYEEEKHQRFFESLFKQDFPNKSIVIPSSTPVPLPKLSIDSEDIAVSEILQSAMDAEKAAHDFYFELSERYEKKPEIKNMLLYIASMEMGHFKLIEIEKENADKFEGYNMEYPLMHVGP